MKQAADLIANVFGNRVISWKCEDDPILLREYLVINLNEEPTEHDKDAIIQNYQSLYPHIFVIENHHTQEADFQLRVYSR
jgi:hypothetical protein